MRKYVIKQLRQLSRVSGKQKTWVSQLSDDQLYEVFLRLRNRESAKSIARHVQKAWGVLPKSSIHSISQGILKFKRRIAHLLLDPPTETIESRHVDDVQLEGIEGLEKIYQGQLNRIHRMMREEEETGIKYHHLNRDLQARAALSKSIVKNKEWELVHHNVDPVRRQKLERQNEKLQRYWPALMDKLGEEGRNRMVEFLERFIEEMENDPDMLELEIGSDGKSRLINPDGSYTSFKTEDIKLS